MSNSTSTVIVKNTFPLMSVMFIILFVMKVFELGAVANWSWWLITAPIWAPLTLSLTVSLLMVLSTALVAGFVLIIAWAASKRGL